MMKAILAFDSYKECITASDACEAAAQGIRCCIADAGIACIPLSDGGEGLLECLAARMPMQWVQASAHDALMNPLQVQYGISTDGTTAYMEMASACGLALIPPQHRDAMQATTWGVGEMILDARNRGCTRIVMGIGGSATTDGGRGMVECLQPHMPLGMEMVVACDVSNPLYGRQGAAYVFAPQKGATAQQVQLLDERLRQWARHTEAALGISPDMASRPGAGAAGGLGYGLMAYLGATLQSGIDTVLDALQFDTQIEGASLILTGEGKSDRQTLMGKVPMGVLKRARAQGIPVCLLSGAIEHADELLHAGFAHVSSINEGDTRPLHQLMQPEVARQNIMRAAMQVMHEVCGI